MSEALQILRDEIPNIHVLISSQTSPQLAAALLKGTLDAARREAGIPDLAFELLIKEPLVAVLPSDPRLTALKAITPRDLVGKTFVSVSKAAPVLRVVIDEYLKQSGVDITPNHEVDHLAMAMSLIASTRGLALLPAYAENFLPWSVTSRRLQEFRRRLTWSSATKRRIRLRF